MSLHPIDTVLSVETGAVLIAKQWGVKKRSWALRLDKSNSISTYWPNDPQEMWGKKKTNFYLIKALNWWLGNCKPSICTLFSSGIYKALLFKIVMKWLWFLKMFKVSYNLVPNCPSINIMHSPSPTNNIPHMLYSFPTVP